MRSAGTPRSAKVGDKEDSSQLEKEGQPEQRLEALPATAGSRSVGSDSRQHSSPTTVIPARDREHGAYNRFRSGPGLATGTIRVSQVHVSTPSDDLEEAL